MSLWSCPDLAYESVITPPFKEQERPSPTNDLVQTLSLTKYDPVLSHGDVVHAKSCLDAARS